MTYTNKLYAIMEKIAMTSGLDWSIKFETGYQCAWSAELRITRSPNTTGSDRMLGVVPDVSEVYYLSGLDSPEDGAKVFWERFRTEV